jgi:hypothetical protein
MTLILIIAALILLSILCVLYFSARKKDRWESEPPINEKYLSAEPVFILFRYNGENVRFIFEMSANMCNFAV